MGSPVEKFAEEQENEEERQQRISEQIQLFGADLLRKANEQVALKQEIERRWIDDLRHYNGKYDRATQNKISQAENKTSTVFVNLTRAKTNTAESKLSDMILPTDDRNWGIKPTPVPDMAFEDDDAPIVLNDGRTPVKESGEPYTYADLLNEQTKEAKKRADLMQREIDDQLKENHFNAQCRDVIHDACVLGTGILKGPMVTKRARKSWREIPGQGYQLIFEEKHGPLTARVDPWNFFPDMSATCFEDVEFIFERHLLTKKHVRDLAKRPGFMTDKLRDVLRSDPRSFRSDLSYLNEIREINGVTQINQDNRYEVWEYHGPVKKTDLMACGCKGIDIDDPMEEYEGVVWFCNDIVLKVALNHMDDDSLPYSVFNWEKDDTSVFGFGVPYRMQASQKVMNGSWRMLLDNAGLSTGPQIIINRKVVEPADGSWELAPRKVWYLTSDKWKAQDAFWTFNIDNHQQELANIFEMAHTLAEEETSLPQLGNQIAQENQPAAMKTLGGTALWMSSQNIMMRRAVKNWDDDITVPVITRMYYWNMQFNPKDEIKGDYDVDARGSSVLLAREIQSRNIMEFLTLVYGNPKWVERLKEGEALEAIAKSMQITASDLIKSDDEVKSEQEQQQGEQQADPEVMKLQMQERIAQYSLQEKQIEAEVTAYRADKEYETKMTELAMNQEISIEEMRQKAGLEITAQNWDREKFYKELGIKIQQGQQANYGLGE